MLKSEDREVKTKEVVRSVYVRLDGIAVLDGFERTKDVGRYLALQP
jgi:hypothetical protein